MNNHGEVASVGFDFSSLPKTITKATTILAEFLVLYKLYTHGHFTIDVGFSRISLYYLSPTILVMLLRSQDSQVNCITLKIRIRHKIKN